MSTPNFWHGNASKVYAVLLSQTAENDEGEMETYYPDDWEYEDLQIYCKEKLDELPYEVIDGESLQEDNRSYPASSWYTLYKYKTFGDMEVRVSVTVKYVSAYYDGGTLDWELAYGDDNSDTYEGAFDYQFEYSDMNAGLRVIQLRNAEEWADNMASEMVEAVEKVLADISQPLKCDAVFSNGEAVYSAA